MLSNFWAPFGGKTIAQLAQWCWVSSGVLEFYLGAKFSDVELPSVTKPLHNLCNGVGCQVSSYVGYLVHECDEFGLPCA